MPRSSILLLPLALVALASCGGDTTSPGTSKNPLSPNLGDMSVGDVRVLTYAQAQPGLTIPASSASATYVIVAANVAGDTGSVAGLTATGDRSTATTPGIRAAISTRTSGLQPRYTRVGGPRGAAFESRLRNYERQHLALHVNRSHKLSPLLRANRVPAGTVPTVGAQYQFNVPGSGVDLCNSFDSVTATVEAVSTHAIILTDNRALNSGLTTASYDSIATEFDTYIYPTEVGYFGAPTDIDQNGHIYLLFTPSVNLLTPAGTANTLGFVGGYTFAGDFLPSTGIDGCTESNQGEIFYLLAPDPTNRWGNVFTTSFIESETRSTMAHEFQHAINEANRIVGNTATTLESAWLDEALSSMAEDNVGRAEAGFSDLQHLSLNTLLAMDTTIFNTFFLENFSRTQLYVTRPDTIGAVVTDDRVESDIAAFGAGWAFLRYTADWFSNNNPRTFTQALVAGPDSGTANLVQHAGAPLDTLLAHWLITMYTDGQSITNLPAQYNYKTYALRDMVSDLCADESCTGSSYLPVTAIGDGSNVVPVSVPSTSAAYFITSQTTGAARTIHFAPATGASVNTGVLRFYIIRTQ